MASRVPADSGFEGYVPAASDFDDWVGAAEYEAALRPGIARRGGPRRRRSNVKPWHRASPQSRSFAGPGTFRDFAERDWLPEQRARVKRGKLAPSTLANYERDVRVLVETFGDRPLQAASLDVAAVQRWADSLAATYAPFTARRLLFTLSSVFTLARKRRAVVRNPCDAVTSPGASSRGRAMRRECPTSASTTFVTSTSRMFAIARASRLRRRSSL